MNMNHYTYKITDPKTGQYYIGSRTSKGCVPELDDYMGSYCSWNPEDEDRLEKEVIAKYPTRMLANSFERKLLIEKLKIERDRKCMNAHIPGIGFCTEGMKHSDISKEMMSISKKELYKKKENNPFYGKRHSYESIKKMSESTKDWWDSVDEVLVKKRNKKISDGNSGKVVSEHTKRKISDTLKKKFSNKNNHPMYGTSRSEKTKNKIRNTLKGRKRSKHIYKSTSKEVIHVESEQKFFSIGEAAREFDVSKMTVSYHCNGKAKNQKFKFV